MRALTPRRSTRWLALHTRLVPCAVGDTVEVATGRTMRGKPLTQTGRVRTIAADHIALVVSGRWHNVALSSVLRVLTARTDERESR